ncbi:hypothetical protein T4A_8959 [Trichinella pseudospiralis]|uniref:Uncharacterized protein n=1 Tax=Trichinella pseudospiralis TaxID=6337 RepID=A0A0V1JMW9_TRIPS|nr:hypothetical protein T4A_8959 [Trichinella pseudospiralis]KRZ36332.1 hypothetical protein T4C_9029 [Trichinella pseudospiralis]
MTNTCCNPFYQYKDWLQWQVENGRVYDGLQS